MAFVEPPLLRHRQAVVGDPVDQQTRREGGHDEHHHPGHDREDLLLHRVHLGRVELELQPHRNAEQHRQHTDRQEGWRGEGQQAEQVEDMQRVRRGQILDYIIR